MIATPEPGASGLPDRRAHRPRRPDTRHSRVIPGHACAGLLVHTGTHLAHITGRGSVPLAVETLCLVCGDRLAIGQDGRVLWTEAQEEREATDGRIGGGTAHRKGVA